MQPRVRHATKGQFITHATNSQSMGFSQLCVHFVAGAEMAPVPVAATKAVRRWLQSVNAGQLPNQQMKTARFAHRVSLRGYALGFVLWCQNMLFWFFSPSSCRLIEAAKMFRKGNEKHLMQLLDFTLRDLPVQSTPSATGLNWGRSVQLGFSWDVELQDFSVFSQALLAAYFVYRAKCAIPALATESWSMINRKFRWISSSCQSVLECWHRVSIKLPQQPQHYVSAGSFQSHPAGAQQAQPLYANAGWAVHVSEVLRRMLFASSIQSSRSFAIIGLWRCNHLPGMVAPSLIHGFWMSLGFMLVVMNRSSDPNHDRASCALTISLGSHQCCQHDWSPSIISVRRHHHNHHRRQHHCHHQTKASWIAIIKKHNELFLTEVVRVVMMPKWQ